MNDSLLIAGGGIGGLACALAMSRAGRAVTVLEQASDFTEVGAGIQLGPNAMRVLADWGCDRAVKAVATHPDDLRVRDAHDGRELGHLRLGSTALSRYGHPHACIHRADLHRLLLEAVQWQTPATLRLRARVEAFDVQEDLVRVALDDGRSLFGAALIGCDGLWSRVRARLLDATPARLTGHLAYRGLIPAERLAHGLRSNSVQVWLGERMHVVSYPVRSGEWINVVAVVHGRLGERHGGDEAQRRATRSRGATEPHDAAAPSPRSAPPPPPPSLLRASGGSGAPKKACSRASALSTSRACAAATGI
jgi:salicylate hydroxylase